MAPTFPAPITVTFLLMKKLLSVGAALRNAVLPEIYTEPGGVPPEQCQHFPGTRFRVPGKRMNNGLILAMACQKRKRNEVKKVEHKPCPKTGGHAQSAALKVSDTV